MERIPFDVAEQHVAALTIYDRFEQMIDRMGDRLLEVAPSVSGWAAGQHMEHLSISNSMTAKLIVRMAEGTMGKTDLEPIAERRDILYHGNLDLKLQAGERLSPSPELTIDQIKTNLARTRLKIEKVGEILDQVPGIDTLFPHVYFGPLDLTEWIVFLHLHSRHHYDIAARVEGGVG